MGLGSDSISVEKEALPTDISSHECNADTVEFERYCDSLSFVGRLFVLEDNAVKLEQSPLDLADRSVFGRRSAKITIISRRQCTYLG